MKKIILLINISLSTIAFSQVAIGKSEISKLSDNSTSNSGISLEFGTGNKGIVLPWVDSAISVTDSVDGTLIYDVTDYKVKYKKSGNWFDLSVDENGLANTSLQDSKIERLDAKVTIGNNESNDTTAGVLVLSDQDKAMVLPKVDLPHLNIKNPAAGMMVYDTTSKQLAVFNGTNWTFWKP